MLEQIVTIFVGLLKEETPQAVTTFGDTINEALLDRIEQKIAKEV